MKREKDMFGVGFRVFLIGNEEEKGHVWGGV
jgi:hypothetical protein